jgi:hypothetical protein
MASTHLSAAPGERREADGIETEDANRNGAAPSAKFRGTEPTRIWRVYSLGSGSAPTALIQTVAGADRLRSHRSHPNGRGSGSAPLPRLSNQTHGKDPTIRIAPGTTHNSHPHRCIDRGDIEVCERAYSGRRGRRFCSPPFSGWRISPVGGRVGLCGWCAALGGMSGSDGATGARDARVGRSPPPELRDPRRSNRGSPAELGFLAALCQRRARAAFSPPPSPSNGHFNEIFNLQ